MEFLEECHLELTATGMQGDMGAETTSPLVMMLSGGVPGRPTILTFHLECRVKFTSQLPEAKIGYPKATDKEGIIYLLSGLQHKERAEQRPPPTYNLER